jgi:Ca2+-binding RTX toxin-like protein
MGAAAVATISVLAGAASAAAATTVSYSAANGLLIQGDLGINAVQPSLPSGSSTITVTVPVTSSRAVPEALTAGPGCLLANGQVTCPVPSGGNVVLTFHGGDGNDIFRGAGYRGDEFVFGEGGNDILAGGPGFDSLDGGAGDDSVQGGTGNDVVKGGDGNDFLYDDLGDDTYNGGAGDDTFVVDDVPAGSDSYTGGGGSDTVTYAARTTPVDITLTDRGGHGGFPGDATTPAEHDTIAPDIQHIVGGAADDSITTDFFDSAPHGFTLDGGPGNDSLNVDRTGSSVSNTLIGGTGTDTITGSNGHDTIEARDGEADTINCLGGTDSVVADLRDSFSPIDCESVDQGAVHEGPNVIVLDRNLRVDRHGRVGVRLRCPGALGRLGCHGRLTLRAFGARERGAPAARYDLRAGATRRIDASLSAGDLRALLRAAQSRILLVSVERGRFGPKTTRRVLPLRR